MDEAALLDDLDADQRHAVTTPSRLVAVIAGAGSGKTRVLTRRVAHRIVTGTADARHTLVLTFTREAAGELRRRLPRLGLHERVEAGTFHSVMLGLLRQRWTDLGRPVPTVAGDRRRLVAEAAGRAGLDETLAEIDWAAARGIGPAAYASAARRAGRRPGPGVDTVAGAYAAYADTKRRRGVIDLDDVLSLAIEGFARDQEFADATRWRFRHLLVDEAQDLNPLQHRLVDLLRHGHDDLFLVGDPAQAVYGFNGADPALLTDVADRFPGIEVVRLPVNHRCTPQIVAAGVHVLDAGGQPAALRSARADGTAVRTVACDDEAHEAAVVARLVRHVDPTLLRRSDVAVLARTHAQIVPLRAALEAAGVPVRRAVDGPGSPYRDAVGAAARQGSAARLRSWAHDVLDGLDADGRPFEPTEVHREVADAVLDYLREHPVGDGSGFRAWVAISDPFGVRDAHGVDLLTFHAAKGREWHTVVVTGVETGLVPHRSATTGPAKAEEARLLYVALTRATDDLVVTWAGRRGGYQRRPSPLLATYVPEAVVVAPPPAALVGDDPARREELRLLEALHDWRAHAARAAGILPDELISASALRRIGEATPADAAELAELTGIGRLTAGRLFPGLAAVLDRHAQSRSSTTTGA